MVPSCFPHHTIRLHLTWSIKYWTSEHKAIDDCSDCHLDVRSSHPNRRACSTNLSDQQSDLSYDRWDGSHWHDTRLGHLDSWPEYLSRRTFFSVQPAW